MSFAKSSIYPPNPQTTRGRATKLSTDAKGERLVYTNDKTVVIRDIRSPLQSVTYTQHNSPTTVARISPSGYYCASADQTGTVRVWDIAGTDQILKLEMKGVMGGKINDLAWDGESKRIIVGGDGRESFGKAFLADSGSSCGEIIGHSKAVNAVAIRSKRPFRAATGSDDGTIVFMSGVPYKFSKTIKSHSTFVNDVAFSPDGELLASVGADGKAFLYDGAEGEQKAELTSGKSSGSLYSLAFSPDSSTLATASASSIVQLYSTSTSQATHAFDLSALTGIALPASQQLGLSFLTPSTLASLSLDGTLNLLDIRASEQVQTLYGPTKGITAVGISGAESSKRTFWAGSFDGGLKRFEVGRAAGWEPVEGTGHSGQVVDIAGSNGDKVYTAGWDDCVREVSPAQGFLSTSVPTGSQPTALVSTVDGELAFVATGESVDVLQGGKKIASKSFKGERVLSLAVTKQADSLLVAVGLESKSIHLYSLEGVGSLEAASPATTFTDNKGAVYSLAFTPAGDLLAAGDSAGKIQVYSVPDQKIKISSRWSSHTGRITSLRWSPDGRHCASASLDTNVFVWSVEKPLRSIKISNAHAGGVSGVEWVGEKTIASGGADAVVRLWEITFHA